MENILKPWQTKIVLLAALTALLYGPFLTNPLVFDDLSFFQSLSVQKYALNEAPFGIRWLPYSTLGWIDLIGYAPVWNRAFNLLLHVAAGASLYLLLVRLLTLAYPPNRQQATQVEWPAFFAALAFALNPAAVYAVGYLIQRSIIMATLFSLLMWLSLLRGLETKSRAWLWTSVGCYFVAVFSKEHAVMAPVVALILVIFMARSANNFSQSNWRLLSIELWPTFLAYTLIAIFVVISQHELLGKAYEPHTGELLEDFATKITHPYPQSVITQCWLFFKYLLLWLVPNPQWMSIDMREPFAESLIDWPIIIGAFCFIGLNIVGARLLWNGRVKGMIGLALLSPASLFLTELSSVRLQEQFVLYRSYLWTPLLFGLFALGLSRLGERVTLALLAVIPAALGSLALDRLITFSNPILLWDDAVRLTAGREYLPGTARTIYIRGYYWHKYSFNLKAINDFDRALILRPNFPAALKERGIAMFELGKTNEALHDFNRAIELQPKYNQAFMGRAEVNEAIGYKDVAQQDFRRACELGWQPACTRLNPR